MSLAKIVDISAEDAITRLLLEIGENPKREGLKDTPQRVLRSYDELFAGYQMDVAKILTIFEDDTANEMVVLRDIELYSFCEHHMLPFFGKAHVAYLPQGRLIGLSKLARIVDAFAKRLQIQERLTQQVTQAIDDHLRPKGAACIIEASHFCTRCRGVGKQNSVMVTSSLTGAFQEAAVRDEFFRLIGK